MAVNKIEPETTEIEEIESFVQKHKVRMVHLLRRRRRRPKHYNERYIHSNNRLGIKMKTKMMPIKKVSIVKALSSLHSVIMKYAS